MMDHYRAQIMRSNPDQGGSGEVMGQILGLGMTHYPGLHMLDETTWVFLRLTLSGKRVPERVKNPANGVTLAGAMSELGRKAGIVDWVERCVMNSNVLNSNKRFAAFPA